MADFNPAFEEMIRNEGGYRLTNIAGDLPLQEKEVAARLVGGQLEVNKAEAENPSVFVAGWRPSIGWIGAIALDYQFILYPLLLWVWAILEAKTWVPAGAKAPVPLQADMLFAIVTGMLGIAGMRSYEKVKGAEATRIGK